MPPTRVLMTGATGFVGRYLASSASREWPLAHKFYLARESAPPALEDWMGISGDLTNRSDVFHTVGSIRPDLIVHLGGMASVSHCQADPAGAWETNAVGSLWLAESIRRHCPRAIVLLASTGDVYGEAFRDGMATEATRPAPQTIYARSKLAAECAVSDVLKGSARLIVGRAFGHSGPGQSETYVLPAFVAQVARIELGRQAPRLAVGNIQSEREFLHVSDVVDAYIHMIRLAEATSQDGWQATYNVSTGRSLSLAQLVEELRRRAVTPFDVVVDPQKWRPSDAPIAKGSSLALQQATGWQPKVSPEQLLSDLLDYWRRQVRDQEER